MFVMGEHVGTTPLEIEDRLIFPVQYPSSKAALYGRIVLERTGCERAVRRVDLAAANEGMMVIELECADSMPPEAPPAERPN